MSDNKEPRIVDDNDYNGAKGYRVIYYLDGVRKKKGFSTKDDAEAFVKKHNAQQKRVGEFHQELSLQDERLLRQIHEHCLAENIPLSHLLQHIDTIKRPTDIKVAIRQAILELRDHRLKVVGDKPVSINAQHSFLTTWSLGQEERHLHTVTTKELVDYITRNPYAGRTKNTFAMLFRGLFTFAVENRKWLRENPVDGIDKFNEEAPKKPIWRPEVYLQMLFWIKDNAPEILTWYVLALFCGQRPQSEADFTAWDQIDLGVPNIEVREGKTGFRIQNLKMSPAAVAWLQYCKDHELPPPQETNANDRGHILRKAMRRLRFKQKGIKRWPVDVLRHTCASNLMVLWGDEGRVATFLGHDIDTLKKYYQNRVSEADAQMFKTCVPDHGLKVLPAPAAAPVPLLPLEAQG